MNTFEVRKIDITAFISGYVAALESMQVSENEIFPKALQTAIDKYSTMPIFRSALEEVIKELSN